MHPKMIHKTLTSMTGDPRVWVHENGTHTGWIIDSRFMPVPKITVKETNALLTEAIKRKPKTE